MGVDKTAPVAPKTLMRGIRVPLTMATWGRFFGQETLANPATDAVNAYDVG